MDNNEILGTADYTCGFCLNDIQEMVDPKLLPCRHPFCLACLKMEILIHQGLQCPVCKIAHGLLDVDQLKDLGDVSNSKSQTPCSSCMTDSDNELGPTNDAIIECLTCDLKYCLEHSELHRKLVGENHNTRSIAEDGNDIAMARKPEYCLRHPRKEIALVCEKCKKLLCSDCEKNYTACCHIPTVGLSVSNPSRPGLSTATPSQTGTGFGGFGGTVSSRSDHAASTAAAPHKLRSISFMIEKITTDCRDTLSLLYEKEREVAWYEKSVSRRLEGITNRGDAMLKDVDQSTTMQIQAIRNNAETLKEAIRQGLERNASAVAEANTQATAQHTRLKELRIGIDEIQRTRSVAEMIKLSERNGSAATETKATSLKRCQLNESVLIPFSKEKESLACFDTQKCRDLEVKTRTVVPQDLEYQKAVQCGAPPHSFGIIDQKLMAVGCCNDINILHMSNGRVVHKRTCEALQNISTQKNNIYALCGNTFDYSVLILTADLQITRKIPIKKLGFWKLISATEKFISLVGSNASNAMTAQIIDHQGDHQLDVSLQLPTEECHGICSTSDASLMILQSSRLTELNIGPRGQPIWSCNTDREIENRKRNERFGMAYDELTRMTYVCGKFDGDTSVSICLISPEGDKLKTMPLANCGQADLIDIKDSLVLVGSQTSSKVFVYKLTFLSDQESPFPRWSLSPSQNWSRSRSRSRSRSPSCVECVWKI